MSTTASPLRRVLPPLEGVRSWRQFAFSAVAAFAGLFAVVGIGVAYYTTSWFMTEPSAIESRVHGVSLGGKMLFLVGIATLLLVRRADRHPAALWTATATVVVSQIAILATLGEALPETARTNAMINATSVPVPFLLALALYPGKRNLLARDHAGAPVRKLLAVLGAVVALAVALPLLGEQMAALASDPFIGDEPRYAQTATGMIAVAIGLLVTAAGVRGWQSVAALVGIVATSIGFAGLVFANDPGAPSTAGSIGLLVVGVVHLIISWIYRRERIAV